MEEEKGSLFMPHGIKSRREYFEGFGQKEFRITLFSAVLSAAFCYLFYKLSGKQFQAMLLFLAVPTATVFFVVRDSNNLSVMDQVRWFFEFSKSQKKYPYRAEKEW